MSNSNKLLQEAVMPPQLEQITTSVGTILWIAVVVIMIQMIVEKIQLPFPLRIRIV